MAVAACRLQHGRRAAWSVLFRTTPFVPVRARRAVRARARPGAAARAACVVVDLPRARAAAASRRAAAAPAFGALSGSLPHITAPSESTLPLDRVQSPESLWRRGTAGDGNDYIVPGARCGDSPCAAQTQRNPAVLEAAGGYPPADALTGRRCAPLHHPAPCGAGHDVVVAIASVPHR